MNFKVNRNEEQVGEQVEEQHLLETSKKERKRFLKQINFAFSSTFLH